MLLFRTKISDAWVKIKTFIKIIIIKNAFFDKIGEKRKKSEIIGSTYEHTGFDFVRPCKVTMFFE